MERTTKSKEASSRKKLKKSHSPKSRKDSVSSKNSEAYTDPLNTAASPSLTIKKVHSKQKELGRVLKLKCALLLREDLDLEYQELREEIGRLHVFKDLLDRHEKALEA